MCKKIFGLILTVFFVATGFSTVDAAELSYDKLYKQRQILNKRLIENPQDIDAHIERGNITLQLFAMNRVDGNTAKDDFDSVLRLKPDCADAYYGLGEYFRLFGTRMNVVFGESVINQYIAQQYGKAKYDFQTFLKSQNNAALFAYSMAIKNAKKNSGKFYIARGDMYSYMNNRSSAIADYTNAINNDKQNFFAYLKRGIVNAYYDSQQSIEDYTVAIDLLNKYDAKESYGVIRPISSVSSVYTEATYGDLLTTAHFNRGEMWQRTNEPEKAIQDFSNALVLQPKDTNILKRRAQTYSTIKQYDNAVADYDKILHIEPKNKTVKEMRKETLKQKKDYDKEIKKSKKAGDES